MEENPGGGGSQLLFCTHLGRCSRKLRRKRNGPVILLVPSLASGHESCSQLLATLMFRRGTGRAPLQPYMASICEWDTARHVCNTGFCDVCVGNRLRCIQLDATQPSAAVPRSCGCDVVRRPKFTEPYPLGSCGAIDLPMECRAGRSPAGAPPLLRRLLTLPAAAVCAWAVARRTFVEHRGPGSCVLDPHAAFAVLPASPP